MSCSREHRIQFVEEVMMTARYPDKVNAPWVSVLELADTPDLWPRWVLTGFEYHEPGDVNIHVLTLDPDGQPLNNVWAWQSWPGDQANKVTGSEGPDKPGECSFAMGGNSIIRLGDPNASGPYQASIDATNKYLAYVRDHWHGGWLGAATEIVRGMGLPENRHVDYRLTFQLKLAPGTPAPIPEPSVSFTVTPGTLARGESATLSWNCQNVTAVFLDGAGVVGVFSETVSPMQTTTYALRVVYPDGSEHLFTQTVTVTQPPPSGDLAAQVAQMQQTVDAMAETLVHLTTRIEVQEQATGLIQAKLAKAAEALK